MAETAQCSAMRPVHYIQREREPLARSQTSILGGRLLSHSSVAFLVQAAGTTTEHVRRLPASTCLIA